MEGKVVALFVSPERGVRNAVDLVRVFPEGLEGDRFRVTTAGASTGSAASSAFVTTCGG